MTDALVEVRGLVNRFGAQTVHDGLDMTVERGEVFGIVGGSGSGKSVLLRSILGLQRPQGGEVRLLGRSLGQMGNAELRQIKEAGPEQKLIAFVMEEKAVPRNGMPIVGGGRVTSGTHSPMLDKGIGMGYVPAASAGPGNELTIDVRGKERRATIVPKPIYKRED